MKCPILKIKSLPNLYKHCTTVDVLHIQISDYHISEDMDFADAYITYILQQLYASIESNFLTAFASRVISHGETYIVFKSNITKKILFSFIHALFAELDLYCNQNVTISYQYLSAILFVEGRNVTMFKTNKLGDDLQDSEAFTTSTVVYDHSAKPRGKQLFTMSEYQNLYKLQSKSQLVTKQKVITKTDPSSTSEDACEYYI